MFGSIGFAELLIIFVAALLLFGPRKLPEIGRAIGKGLGEFRKASNDLKRAFNAETALEEDEPRPPLRGGHLPTRPPELANRGPLPAAPAASDEVVTVTAPTSGDAASVETTAVPSEAAPPSAPAETVARQPVAAESSSPSL